MSKLYKPRVGDIICFRWDQENTYGLVIPRREYVEQTGEDLKGLKGFCYKDEHGFEFLGDDELKSFRNVKKSSKEEVLSDLEDRLAEINSAISFFSSI